MYSECGCSRAGVRPWQCSSAAVLAVVGDGVSLGDGARGRGGGAAAAPRGLPAAGPAGPPRHVLLALRGVLLPGALLRAPAGDVPPAAASLHSAW